MSNGRFAKPKEKKRRFWPFLIVMVVYAVLALVAIGFGLDWFYGFIDAYEQSRPKHVLEQYMSDLTAEHICNLSTDVIAKVDHKIQSEEQCREYMKEALSKGFNYAKKSSESTDKKQVYVLRTGTQVVGQFVMEIVSQDEYGFTYWTVTGESFDMSYLIGEKVSITAPDHYPVTVNGVKLDSSYVVGEPVKYEALKQFYKDYDLPTIVTYEAGPFLGNFEMVVTDPDGKLFDLSKVEDKNRLAENCSPDTVEELDEFADLFIKRYVTYAGGSNKTADANLAALLKLIVPGSEYAERMHGAWYGQTFSQSYGDKIVEIRNNYFFQLEEGKYVCDVTYELDTTGKQGVVRTVNNVRIVVVETNVGLRVLTVYSY